MLTLTAIKKSDPQRDRSIDLSILAPLGNPAAI